MSGTKRDARHGSAREAQRNLALAVRRDVPPELWIDWHMAIWAGKGSARIKPNRRTASGWVVVWDEGENEFTSTLEQRAASAKALREAGYGLPAQMQVLEVDVRQAMLVQASGVGVRDLAQLVRGPEARAQLEGFLRDMLALPAAGGSAASGEGDDPASDEAGDPVSDEGGDPVSNEGD